MEKGDLSSVQLAAPLTVLHVSHSVEWLPEWPRMLRLALALPFAGLVVLHVLLAYHRRDEERPKREQVPLCAEHWLQRLFRL